MSNENEMKDPTLETATADLRNDDWAVKTAKPFVKPSIHMEGAAIDTTATLTPAQILAISQIVQKQTKQTIQESRFDPSMSAQAVRKSVVPITDFSQLTMDSIYDLSIPIEAKEFMSADGLKIDLKDTNYEARWVNKNPQRLGEMKAKGFTFIVIGDLISSEANESIQTSIDANGHYTINDVVAMKIDKATYYAALRAAHLRAISTTDQASSRRRAATQANEFMNRESGYRSDYSDAAANKKMTFYDPDITI